MKQAIILSLLFVWAMLTVKAQVTQINSNRSLSFVSPLNTTKAIFISITDSSIWASDGTLAGTIQLSATITYKGDIGLFNGNFIFSGNTTATGTELFITDGTAGGTLLLKDINPGTDGSDPEAGGAVLNGFLYFSAIRPAEGRELWKTNGTGPGTDILKDIVPGAGSSNTTGSYDIISTGTFLLFQAVDVALGLELWKSDGSSGGTALLKDINPGPDSSAPQSFTSLNSNTILFTAFTAANNRETWKTDGTGPGTVLLKDINPFAGSIPFIGGEYYYIFNGKAYFNANDGVNGDELWWTDGTQANTLLFKEFEPGPSGSLNFIFDVVIVGNKFFFPSTNLFGTRYEIIESNGTSAGTLSFKDFTAGAELPILLPNYDYFSQSINQPLFQGDKFFFTAATAAEGYELWISNGNLAGTQMVKDINPGAGNGIDAADFSYIYTTTDLFFPANNGTNGIELWRSNGSLAGTSMVADIVSNAPGSDPINVTPLIVNSRVLFEANNKDLPAESDLYAVNGIFTPIVIPVKLLDFTVMPKLENAILQWHSSLEINSKDYIIQRSDDGRVFENIGNVAARGNSTNTQAYVFTDAGIMNAGKQIIYYRLMITDVDGKSTYSNIILLKLGNNKIFDARLITNPIAENLQLILSGAKENIQLSVLDVSGKIILSQTLPAVSGQVNIPVPKLLKGMYVLVLSAENEKKIIRFVK